MKIQAANRILAAGYLGNRIKDAIDGDDAALSDVIDNLPSYAKNLERHLDAQASKLKSLRRMKNPGEIKKVLVSLQKIVDSY